MMRSFVKIKEPRRSKPMKTTPQLAVAMSSSAFPSGTANECPARMTANVDRELINPIVTERVFAGYLSDLPMSDESDMDEELDSEMPDQDEESGHKFAAETRSRPFLAPQLPPLKRQRLEIPAWLARQQKQAQNKKDLEQALDDIEKLVQSKKEVFDAGQHGLQAYRARSIQSCLWMIIRNKRGRIEASKRAAEGQGFSEQWGGRMVRHWVRRWVEARELPVSSRGRHTKTFSLYDDPAIRDELRSFVRSNKWAMNPEKLVQFSKDKMVPAAAKQYLEHITDIEMPQGLKNYMELELFPRLQLKSIKGISLPTARRLLRREGFCFQEYKKSLYYDGHERPDVINDRQARFLPEMAQYKSRLVEYVVGDVGKELLKTPDNYVETRIVLCSHDEMTAQANDDAGRGWLREQRLRKKGVGRGVHQSDVICPTIGWLEEASQTLEYGKNYEGYWTGELFIKQVIISFD